VSQMILPYNCAECSDYYSSISFIPLSI